MFLIHSNRSRLTPIDINRGAVTICVTPHWRRRRLCGDDRCHHHITNRGAVANPANQFIFVLTPVCEDRRFLFDINKYIISQFQKKYFFVYLH